MRVGNGFDVHRFCEGRPLILGGVEVPHSLGLLGHSDADVLVHAIMDALLGAAGLPDIGNLFPDTDPSLKGVSSLKLLAFVGDRLTQAGWKIGNIDSILIAEAPKMKPFIPEMINQISNTLKVHSSQVNVKATTTERLGFTGRGEGIAAEAVVLILQDAQ